MKAEPRLLLLAMFYSLYVATPANATCADKIDGHANAVVNTPGNYEIQKIDGNSTAQISAADIHLCQKIDGNSDAIITSGSNIHIDQKIDGHSAAQLIAESGSIQIGSGHGGDKIDGRSDVWIVSGGRVDIKGKIDGASQVRIRAGGPITISGKIDGASEVRWCGPSAPAVGGGIGGNAKVIRLGECPSGHLWDLVPSNFGLDPNGFLRMPNWKWASPGPPQVAALRDACDDCPCRRGTWGVDAPDHQERNWLAFPSCTHGPIHENSNNVCSGKIAEEVGNHASGMGYHMNWGPVEYEGSLHWAGRSTWVVLFTEHDKSGDNEYTFNMLRPELFLVAKNMENKGVHLEFNSTETVDEWDGTGTWWERFHNFVDSHDDPAISDLLGNNTFVITIGMLGLDVAHTAHHAELHPVYAMFVRDPPGAPAPPDGEARWSFFVRNWGNEGACGHDQEKLGVDHIDVKLPDRRLGSLINVRPYRHDGDQSACPQEWFTDPNGVLRFPMASPEMKCGWVGELTMVKRPFHIGPILDVAVDPEEEQEVPVDPAIMNKLNATDRQHLMEQLSALSEVPRTKPAFGEKVPVKRLSHPLPRFEAFRVTGTNVKAESDPSERQLEERKRQFIEEFVKARHLHFDN